MVRWVRHFCLEFFLSLSHVRTQTHMPSSDTAKNQLRGSQLLWLPQALRIPNRSRFRMGCLPQLPRSDPGNKMNLGEGQHRNVQTVPLPRASNRPTFTNSTLTTNVSLLAIILEPFPSQQWYLYSELFGCLTSHTFSSSFEPNTGRGNLPKLHQQKGCCLASVWTMTL